METRDLDKVVPFSSALIIDDDPVHNFLSQLVLSSIGIKESCIRGNGHSALLYIQSLIQKNEPLPELILLDVFMPVLDGFEFLEVFDQLEAETKMNTLIVLISGTISHIPFHPKTFRLHSTMIPKPFSKEKMKKIWEEYFLNDQNQSTFSSVRTKAED